MASPETFNFTDGNSGNVQKTGFTYTPTTGWAAVDLELIIPGNAEKRGMMEYDTSVIPDDANVTLVEFLLILAVAQPLSQCPGMDLRIGPIIRGSLDGDAGEFTGGTQMLTGNFSSYWFNNTWYDLSDQGKDPTGYINKTGTTDIAFWGAYNGIVTEGKDFNRPKSKCQLRVTYTLGGITRRMTMGAGL